MEFIRKDVEVTIPKVMGTLAEKGLKAIHAGFVYDYQTGVIEDDLRSRRAEYWGKHRARWFFSRQYVGIPLLMTLVLVAVWLKNPIAAIAGMISFGYLSLSTLYGLEKIEKREWSIFPLESFENEYKGSVPESLCGCYDGSKPNCINPSITFEVENHPASGTRFLLACNPYKPEEPKYYVDYWEKP